MLVLSVARGLVTIGAEWCILEVVLVRVGPGGPPADDGGGHREPPPHADQTHPEPHGRGPEEVLVSLEEREESEENQSRQHCDESEKYPRRSEGFIWPGMLCWPQ